MKKTLLLVAIPNSIHTCRWIRQIDRDKWDVHLFSSIDGVVIRPEVRSVKFHHPLYVYWNEQSVPLLGRWTHLLARIFNFVRRYAFETVPGYSRPVQLAKLIKKIKPDLIHSMEIQAAGYLTLAAKKQTRGDFPPWLVTNWGSDIYLFGRINWHRDQIKDVLSSCEYYSCECERDVGLARAFGFTGRVMPVFPNTGGFLLEELAPLRSAQPTAERNVIMLKGYQNWAGRAVFGLRALELCAELLAKYELVIYSADDAVSLAAELFSESTKVPVRVLPNTTSHQEMLEWHARARISIGLSISDAISTSLLESMVMGSFPIQSCTACADEWFENGISGMTVPPEDPVAIEKAIRLALSNDALVNEAAKINWRTAQERLDGNYLKQQTNKMYASLLN